MKRLFGADRRAWISALFTGFVVSYYLMTFVGTAMRGHGMDLYLPWLLPTPIE